MHDIGIYVGSTKPTKARSPAVGLALCTLRSGQLSAKKGAVVTLTCSKPVTGQYVAVQLRWVLMGAGQWGCVDTFEQLGWAANETLDWGTGPS